MSDQVRSQTTAYEKLLPNQAYSLRMGTEVPPGDVNLAYIHSPRLNSDENIALINTAAIDDNIIPKEQLESIMVPDENGKLHYAKILSDNDPVVLQPPYDIIPTTQFNLTNRFMNNKHHVSHALYYKFELYYHYDPRDDAKAPEEERGKVFRYTGDQIKIADESGTPVTDENKYMIYAQATSNPHIYKVMIYLHRNTNEVETVQVTYNHVENILADDQLIKVRKTIELYTNPQALNHDHMVEGGKSRVINASGAFIEIPQANLSTASTEEEVYAIETREDLDQCHIYVKQKSEADMREKPIFQYRLNARYKNERGQTKILTFGYVSDWVLNPEALLPHEAREYSEEYKMLSIPGVGLGAMDAKNLMEMVLPFGVPSIPSNAEYYVEDTQGQILYTTRTSPDDPNVASSVTADGMAPPVAKLEGTALPAWESAKNENIRIKSNPIEHTVSVFAERQQTEFPFSWEACGEGYTEQQLTLNGTAKVCMEAKRTTTTTVEYLDDFSTWNYMGKEAVLSDWDRDANGRLYCQKNKVDLYGYYQDDNAPYNDYEFSAVVEVKDLSDDDIIGILFRVQNSHEYYCFAWEKETMMKEPYAVNGQTVNGTGRIIMDGQGVWSVLYNDDYDNYPRTTDWNQYLTLGFADKKKRIFKSSPQSGTAHAKDVTGNQYEDITLYNSDYRKRGWERNTTYKITVRVKGNKFKIYIGTDLRQESLGELVCEGEDPEDTYSSGKFGIFNISQRECYWDKIYFKETNTDTDYFTACTEEVSLVLMNHLPFKLFDDSVVNRLKPQIYNLVGSYDFEVTDIYIDVSDSRIEGYIDDQEIAYVYSESEQAGGIEQVPWYTQSNGMNARGQGVVKFQPDGEMSILYTLDPSVALQTDTIPSEVLDFHWTSAWKTAGNSIVRVSLASQNQLNVTASLPPITAIEGSQVVTFAGEKMIKQDGLKEIATLMGSEGFYSQLRIPEDIPQNEILLRIERGDAQGNHKEYRVNYRFRYRKDGTERFEIDQYNQGVNRIRLANITEDMKVDLVAWTTFEEIEVVPVYALKIDDPKKIDIQKPKVSFFDTEVSNWFVRVRKGETKRRLVLPEYEEAEQEPQIYKAYPALKNYQGKEVILDYTIPEYEKQPFEEKPIIYIQNERPIILNATTIQTRYAPLVLPQKGESSVIEVKVKRKNFQRVMRVSDIDAAKGIITLHDKIHEQDEVTVNYKYEEHWFTYRGFVRDGDMFHLDLNPSPGHEYTIAEDGLLSFIPGDCPVEREYQVEDHSSHELLVKPIHVYVRPTKIYLVQNEEIEFISDTVTNQSIFHTDQSHYFDPQDYKYDPTMLRLGKVSVQANAHVKKDVVVLDTRTRGGGLDEILSREIIAKVNKESLHHFDIGFFDGEAYQENGVFIVCLPRTLLKEYGGHYHESEIRAAIAKHKAYGALPIVEYYE